MSSRRKKLKCETDTKAMERRIRKAWRAHMLPYAAGSFNTVFEHDQWFVETPHGFIYSVVDELPGIDGFGFECLSRV